MVNHKIYFVSGSNYISCHVRKGYTGKGVLRCITAMCDLVFIYEGELI